MEVIFRSIFWIGIVSIVLSLFLDFVTYTSYFVLSFLGGILLVVYSLYEQYALKKISSPQEQQSEQQPEPAVAQRLVPLKTLQPVAQPTHPQHTSFFTRLFSHFHFSKKTATSSKQSLPIASLSNVKSLFTEDLHLQQRQQTPGTFPKPLSSPQPINYQRTIPQPPVDLTRQQASPQPQRPFSQQPHTFLPFEEGLEHYVPTGAEQLPHDHHNRYAEDRETISRPSDTRYQQVSQQRTPIPQSLPHHLSLLHYLHYKDKKHEKILFSILLCLSIALIAISLSIPFTDYLAFVVTFLFLGLILLSASLAELFHLRHHQLLLPITSSQQPTSQPVTPPQQPLQTKPVVSQQRPIASPTTSISPVPPSKILPGQVQDTEHLATLIAYIHQSLHQHYPLDVIRAAAKKSGWPDSMIEQAIAVAQKNPKKKKKLLILVSLVATLIILLLVLNSSDMFLVPYWLELLSDASPQFYFIMIGFFLLVILLFVNKVRKVYKGKQIQYHIQEQRQVEEIKKELQKMPTTLVRGTYETDFDKLYKLISEKQKLTITEVAQGFNISRKEAEEWGKILKEQGLIELHYPTVGDLELLWKK